MAVNKNNIKKVKKLFVLALLTITCPFATRAQTTTCHGDWGEWYNVYTFAHDVNFRISFKYLLTTKQGCTESYYRFDNPVPRPGAYLKFKFSYKKQDGTVGIQNMERVELDRTGIRQDNTANWYLGYDMIRIYDIQYVDPNKDKKISTDKDLGIKPPVLPALTHRDSLNKGLAKPKGDAMGRRADNTNTPAKPVVESAALNNRNPQQQYQQLANAYVNAADNSSNDISRAMNMGVAQANAQAGGNKGQIAQIQQAQQRQQTKRTNQIISSGFEAAGALATLLGPKPSTRVSLTSEERKEIREAGERARWEQSRQQTIKEDKKELDFILQTDTLKKLESIIGRSGSVNFLNYELPNKVKYLHEKSYEYSENGQNILIALDEGCALFKIKKTAEAIGKFKVAAELSAQKNRDMNYYDVYKMASERKPELNEYFVSAELPMGFGKVGLAQAKAINNISKIRYDDYTTSHNVISLKQAFDWCTQSIAYYKANLDTFVNTGTYKNLKINLALNTYDEDRKDYYNTKMVCYNNLMVICREAMLLNKNSNLTTGLSNSVLMNLFCDAYNTLYSQAYTHQVSLYGFAQGDERETHYSYKLTVPRELGNKVSLAKEYLMNPDFNDLPVYIDTARLLLEKAVYEDHDASGNLLLAYLNLGHFKIEGNKSAPDILKAFNLIKNGANSDAVDCIEVMGDIYTAKFGWDKIFTPDGQIGVVWYEKAIERDTTMYPLAQLAQLYYLGKKVPESKLKAARYVNSMFIKKSLSRIIKDTYHYFDDISYTDVAFPNKVAWFINDLGSEMSRIANNYRDFNKRYKDAIEYYTEGDKIGNPDCAYNLGVFYEKGYGVNADLAIAKRYYEKAANSGQKAALERMMKF